MTQLTDINTRLIARRNEITKIRAIARRKYGRNKAYWPIDVLEEIQNLINDCRADERLLRDLASQPVVLPIIPRPPQTLDAIEQRDLAWNARYQERFTPPYRTRPLLVVDNGKGMR